MIEDTSITSCPICGAGISCRAKWCPQCGEPEPGQTSVDGQAVQGFSATEVLHFTGYARARLASSRWRYYPRVFMELAVGRKVSWNWAGCIFGWYWFLFRKLYLAALVFIALHILGAVVLVFGRGEKGLFGSELFISLVLRLFMGLFANTFYFRRFKQVLDRERPRAIHPGVLEARLECAGRVDWIVPLLAFTVVIAVKGAFI